MMESSVRVQFQAAAVGGPRCGKVSVTGKNDGELVRGTVTPAFAVPCIDCVIPHMSHDMFEKYVLHQGPMVLALAIGDATYATNAVAALPKDVRPSLLRFSTFDQCGLPLMLTPHPSHAPIATGPSSDTEIGVDMVSGRKKIAVATQLCDAVRWWRPDIMVIPQDRSSYMSSSKKRSFRNDKRNKEWLQICTQTFATEESLMLVHDDPKFKGVVNPVNKSEQLQYRCGSGILDDVVSAIHAGCDVYESYLPFSMAEMGFMMDEQYVAARIAAALAGVSRGTVSGAEYVNLLDPVFELDKRPLGDYIRHTHAYVHHLFEVHEMLGASILSIVNLRTMVRFFARMHEIMDSGQWEAFYRGWTTIS